MIGNVSQNPIVPTNDGKIHTFKYTPTGAKNYEYWDPQQNENIQTLDVYSGSGNNWMLEKFKHDQVELNFLINIFTANRFYR